MTNTTRCFLRTGRLRARSRTSSPCSTRDGDQRRRDGRAEERGEAKGEDEPEHRPRRDRLGDCRRAHHHGPRARQPPTIRCACIYARWARSSFCRCRRNRHRQSASRPVAGDDRRSLREPADPQAVIIWRDRLNEGKDSAARSSISRRPMPVDGKNASPPMVPVDGGDRRDRGTARAGSPRTAGRHGGAAPVGHGRRD